MSSDESPKILVCEDDFGSRKILSRILGSVGTVDTAINGLEAVEAVTSDLEGSDRYDIITLDLNMPEMGGQEALGRIRKFEEESKRKRSTILITTANNDTAAVMAAFREQCDGYLIKPIRRDDLLGKLSEFGYDS